MAQTAVLVSSILCLAFVLGFATRRGGICVVAATDQWVTEHCADGVHDVVLAGALAGAVLMFCAWQLPEWIPLSQGYSISAVTLAGGALFGVGAYVNSGCAFGTLVKLSGGNTNYVGTVAGAVTGASLMSSVFVFSGEPAPSILAGRTELAILFLALFIVIVVHAAWRAYDCRRPHAAQETPDTQPATRDKWAPSLVIPIIGIAGVLLHATAGDWTYMAVLSRQAASILDPAFPGAAWPAVAGSAALFIGAIMAAVTSRTFKLHKMQSALAGRNFAGGMIMGVAAATIPGGNDVLMLYGIPSLAPNALAACATMIGTLAAIFYVKNRLKPAAQRELAPKG